MPPDPNRVEACKTLLEQIKLLVALASAFLLAPAVFYEKLNLVHWTVIFMEGLFVVSVMSGYAATGALAGTQEDGQYNIYRPFLRTLSLLQLGFYIGGMVCLFVSLYVQKNFHLQENVQGPTITNNYFYTSDSTIGSMEKQKYSIPALRKKGNKVP
jgi:hypothetical protein